MHELRVAAISDEMTRASYAPECKWITFRPDNWQATLEIDPPHILFVESAWSGNDGAWQYRIGTYTYQDSIGLPDLSSLVSWARDKGIPTVFWNKEDPVHFDKFKEAAVLFDVIATSDSDRIAAYRELPNVRAERFVALPFAAQPSIHNPIRIEEERIPEACFAGTYYGTRHDTRRAQQERLLDGAIKVGLRIYDRMAGSDSAAFAFPDRFADAIVGGVPYQQMLEIYKRFRVFLNTNSVSSSPTMFSRRVFELLASGTPVVSTPSVGIEQLFGDVVAVVDSESETVEAIERLMEDDAHWRDISTRGIRLVMRNDTYAHRLAELAAAIDIELEMPYPEEVALMVADPGQAHQVIERISQQTLMPAEILVALNSDQASDDIDGIAQALPATRVRTVPIGETQAHERIRTLARAAVSPLCIPFDPTAPLSPHTIEDMVLCCRFAPGAVIGAAERPEDEHRYVTHLAHSVVMVPTELLARRGCETTRERAGWFAVGARFYAMRRDAEGAPSL
jgi:hypothetical protein